jgi:hypothetical protein
MFTEYRQHIRQQRYAGTEQNEADHIERTVLFLVIRQMQAALDQAEKLFPIDQTQTDDSDRNIHKK